jgi:acyl-CoA dehydrogenase
MEFEFSPKVKELQAKLTDFMESRIYPNERVWREQVESAANRWTQPAIMEELKVDARKAGLWNLFLPNREHGAGLTNLEYAPLAEIMGRSLDLAPEATNCAAPDTGNMEILAEFGTAEHK